MSLIPALLQAIVRIDGEALVMHAGDKPYVVSPTEQVDLASRGLTLEAVNGMVSQLLPAELSHVLDEFGAVQHELPPMAEFPGEHFTVVAARGGNDVWVEIRRRRIPEDDRVPDEFFAPREPESFEAVASVQATADQAIDATSAVEYDADELPAEMLGFDPPDGDTHGPEGLHASASGSLVEARMPDDDLQLPHESQLWPAPAAKVVNISAVTTAHATDEEGEFEIDLDSDEGGESEPEPRQPIPMRPTAQMHVPPGISIIGAAPVDAAADMPSAAGQAVTPHIAASIVAPSTFEPLVPWVELSLESTPVAELVAAKDDASLHVSVAGSVDSESLVERTASWAEMSLEASSSAGPIAVPDSDPAAAWIEMSLEAAPVAASLGAPADVETADTPIEAGQDRPSMAAWLGGLIDAPQVAARAGVASLAGTEEANRAAAAAETEREAARIASEEAEREAARIAAEEAARELARLAAEEAEREATRKAAAQEAEREAQRVAREAARRAAARMAAAVEAQREAERVAAEAAVRVAAEEAALEAARVAAAEEAELLAARMAAEQQAQREAERMAAEEAEREAARMAAAQEALRQAERLAAEETAREAARVAAEEALREAARLAAAEEAQWEAARVAAQEAALEAALAAAAQEVAREAARIAAMVEAERAAAAEAALEAARVAAAEEARREAERLAAEAAVVEAARLAALKEAEREAARVAAAEDARRDAERMAAEEAALEAARIAAIEKAEREAARMAAAEEAEREAARGAAEQEARRESERMAAENAAADAARAAAAAEAAWVAAEQEARREAERAAAAQAALEAALVAVPEEARREAERLAAESAAVEAARAAAAAEAARIAAEQEARREAERVVAEEAALEAARLAAIEEAEREAARMAAAEEAEREAARFAAEQEAQREAERAAAAEAALEAARVAVAEETRREAERVAAEEAALEAARVAGAAEAEREAARMAAIEEADREAARVAAEREAQRENERAAAAEAVLQAACMAAVDEARREAERLVAEAAALEAARVAAAAEAERQVARIAAADEARREAVRIAAEESALEASRLWTLAEAEREAARMAAFEEAEREAARLAAAEEARRESEREGARREAARVDAAEEARRQAERAAAEEAEREAARIAAETVLQELPSEELPLAASVDSPLGAASNSPSFEVWPIAVSVQVIHETEPAGASYVAPDEAPAYDASMGIHESDVSAIEIRSESSSASVDPPHETRAVATPYQVELDSGIDAHQLPSMAASVEPIGQEAGSAPTDEATVAEPLHEVASSQARPVPVQPAVVVNISRNPIRSETPVPVVEDPMLSGLERLLRVSSARGASTLYLSSGSRPSVRVDGELQLLDGEPVHAARDVEALLLTLMPARSHEALRTGAATEWISQLEGVGRVRCMSFRDQRGPGGVFRLMPTRSVSADEVGLPKQMQALAIEPEGLVLIAGTRSSGKRTTMAAFVDLMNRTRRDHIITIEREINIQHDRGNSFISQREVRGNDEDLLAAMRAALREDPDVLVVEELRTGALMNVALEVAAAGRLVVGGFTAHTATGAIDRIIDLYAPDDHRQVQMALAHAMRGVVAQVLLRKVGGGRLPAREVLLNTPAVSSAIAEGKTSQLPMAIEGGRGHGMMPLNDALVGLVRNGSVEVRDAYRHSPDRPGFLAALNRYGIDTSFVEHLANG